MNRRSLFALAFALLVFSLLTVGALCAESPEGNLDAYPMNVFVGVSAPYDNADKMFAEALYRCARSDALSESIYVTAKLINESTNATQRTTATDGSAFFVADDIESIASRLKVLAILTRSEGTIVIAMDPMKDATNRPYIQQFDPSGKPSWIDNPPDIPGYIVAVGETLAHTYVRDSLEAADISAAYALLDKKRQGCHRSAVLFREYGDVRRMANRQYRLRRARPRHDADIQRHPDRLYGSRPLARSRNK